MKIFKKVMDALHQQEYPSGKIEHLIMDGGSDNGALEVVKKYKVKLFSDIKLKNEVWTRASLGIHKAKNDVILILPSDNLLVDKKALLKLVKPFIDDPQVISTYTARYGYSPQLQVLDRYGALLGIYDPVAFYLGKADRMSWIEDNYNKGTTIRKDNGYSIVEFNEKNLPTVGDNGFLVKRKIILKAQITPEKFFHTDIFIDLIRLGYNRFGVVDNTEVYHVNERSVADLVKRRVMFMKRDASKTSLENRRYAIYSPKSLNDNIKLFLFIFYTITLIQPLYFSIKGYLKIKDSAWFLHPVICYLFFISYLFSNLSLVYDRMKNNFK